MQFFDPYTNKNEGEKTNAGDEELPQYVEDYDKEGKRYLKKNKPINIYEKIQAHAGETDIYNIIERYEMTGDESLLNRRKQMFGDFTGLPKSEIEAHNRIIKAEKAFEGLDKEIRAEFNNSASEFAAAVLNNTIEQRLEKFKPKQPEIKQPETTQNTNQTQGVNLNE